MDRLQDRSEGDINLSPRREAWQAANLDAETRDLLAEDARYFLQQSLSTPCLNALRACEGIYIEDLQGRRYMDFHGNNVHQVGFSNPQVIAAVASARGCLVSRGAYVLHRAERVRRSEGLEVAPAEARAALQVGEGPKGPLSLPRLLHRVLPRGGRGR